MENARLWTRSLLTGTLAAVVYGIVHDQITVRISPPYLMDWHPEIVSSRDPTVVALAWGVVATWWFGLVLGAVLAAAATLGSRPPAPWAWIARSIRVIFLFAAFGAIVAGTVAKGIAFELPSSLFGALYSELSPTEWQAFSQAAAIHEASYDVAGVATLVAAVLVYRRRAALPSSEAALESGGP